MTPYQIVHAATAVITPVKAKNAPLDWRARSRGVGMLKLKCRILHANIGSSEKKSNW
jgi:hypothetical protein